MAENPDNKIKGLDDGLSRRGLVCGLSNDWACRARGRRVTYNAARCTSQKLSFAPSNFGFTERDVSLASNERLGTFGCEVTHDTTARITGVAGRTLAGKGKHHCKDSKYKGENEEEGRG